MSEPAQTLVPLEGGVVDLQRQCIRRGPHTVDLTEIEADLLAFLCARAGAPVSRTTLLTQVWGYHPAAQTRAVDAAIRRLRTKLEATPARPRHLLTVRGVGYRFVPLPRPADPAVIGRAALRERLEGLRGLITLVGPGGVGKTTLARTLDRACFVDLSDARTLAHCLVAVSSALGVPLVGAAAGQIDDLGHALCGQAWRWLILDNAEQVLPAMRQCVPVWRRLNTATTVVVTSREALGLADEQVVEVPPLSATDAEALLARLTPAGWTQDAALPQLLDQLDRLPLALELAAGRAGIMSARQMLDRLPRAPLSTRGARQSSLAASIDWSWALCDAGERAALAAASTFAGPFTLEDAEVVLPDAARVVDRLQSLTDKHLVRRTPDGFRLLETIRAFAATRLADDDPAWTRHARWCLWRAAEGPDGLLPNLLQAFDAVRVRAPGLALEVGVAATRVLYRRGPRDLHHRLVADCAALANAAVPGPTAVEALLAQADVQRRAAAHVAAAQSARVALQYAELIEDSSLVARALGAAAIIAHYAGDADADALFAQAQAAATSASPAVRAEVMRGLANRHIDRGELPEAEAANAQALHLLRLAGDTGAEAVLLGTLGVVALEDGRHVEAQAALTRALALHRDRADRRFAAVAQTNLAQVVHLLGRLDEAADHARASLRQHVRMGNRRFEGFAQYIGAAIAHEQGDLDAAVHALTQAMSRWQSVGERRFAGYGACRLALLESERGASSAARAAAQIAVEQLKPADAAFARWAIDGGAVPVGESCFGRICLRLIAARADRSRL